VVLRDISIKIERGQFVCILGPSGSGKTTLLRIIAGLTKPTNGQILMNDIDQSKIPTHKRNIGFVFQSPTALFPHLNVFTNVSFPFERGNRKLKKGEDWKAEVRRILKLIGLDSYAHEGIANLSGGELQRVALARALVYKPALLLLDEPLSSLDNVLKDSFLDLMRKLHRELDITFLYVTHDEREAIRVSTHIAVLHDVCIQQFASVETITTTPDTPTVAKLIGGWNILKTKLDHSSPPHLTLSGQPIIPFSEHYPIKENCVELGVPIEKTHFQFELNPKFSNNIFCKVTVLDSQILYRFRQLNCALDDGQRIVSHIELDRSIPIGSEGYITFLKEDTHVFIKN
jgi:ABC-type Fe3+/spermidine/putrescine transport system ATPase subunit